jgi:hypothetical protein
VPFAFRVILNYTNGVMLLPATCLIMEPSSLGNDPETKKQVGRRKKTKRERVVMVVLSLFA